MTTRLHKLVDKAGAVWLPFALNKLKYLARFGGAWASKRFIMPDGAHVSVKTAGDDQTVIIQYFHKYEFFAFPPQTFAFERARNKNEQLAEWVQSYVRKVEQMVKKHPYQWFNFFDFWATPAPARVEEPALPTASQPGATP